MDEHPQIDAEQASKDAIHKAKNAAQAREMARQAQLDAAVEKTAIRTKADMLDVLKDIFGDGDAKNPERMTVLVRRIPLLCQNVKQMHDDIQGIRDNMTWATRVVIGGVITGLLMLFFK